MATSRIDLLDQAFDDHPSLSASLEDFEHTEHRSPVFAIPSQHSGFRSDESEPDAETNSEGPWSPAGWRKPNVATHWYRHQPYAQSNQGLKPSVSPLRSRGTSPQYESARDDNDDGDLTIPANIPLPRGSLSPVKERSPSPSPYPERQQEGQGPSPAFEKVEHHTVPPVPENANNCMRMNDSPKKTNRLLTDGKIFDSLFAPKFSIVQNPLMPRSRGFADMSTTHPNLGRPSLRPSSV